MCRHTPNEPDHHHCGRGDHTPVLIPQPRQAPDDDGQNLPITTSDQVVWWYDQTRKCGGNRRFSGHVNLIGGAEGDRLRSDLSAVIRDLLQWSAEQYRDQSTEDGETA